MMPQQALRHLAAVALLALLAACGGGGSDNSAPPAPDPAPAVTPVPPVVGANAVTIVVDRGTDGRSLDSPYVTVTVCQPGTSNCQSIDHILLDTGSFGLRVAASALGSLALPTVAAPDGHQLAECAGFVSGFSWGSVRRADVRMGGEQAGSVPVQVVDDPALPVVPTACSNTGSSIGAGGGAKGILGVGFDTQDCGSFCANSAASDVYFSCVGSTCTSSAAPLASQVTNPVALFATDNNGVVITLPDVPLGGVAPFTGSLVFGVGTQANNQVGTATVYTANSVGNVTSVYKGRSFTAFLDSGSNGIFFDDSTLPCFNTSSFYCPATPLSLSATITGTNGATANIPFAVENPNTLRPGSAAARLAGDIGSPRVFDWGLPFFFGRTVFLALDGAPTPAGPGPFWAF